MPDQDARILRRQQQRKAKANQQSDRVVLTRWDASAGGWVATASNGAEKRLGELSNGAAAIGQAVPRKGGGFKVLPFVPAPQPLPFFIPGIGQPPAQFFVLFAREYDASGIVNGQQSDQSDRFIYLWSDRQFNQGNSVVIPAKETILIGAEQPTTDPPPPPLTWAESPHPEDGPLKPTFSYSADGQTLTLNGFTQPANGASQGPFVSAPPGGISWEVELVTEFNPSTSEDWLFYLTGTVDQSGHTSPSEDVRNDIRVEFDVQSFTAQGSRISFISGWEFDWRVQKEPFDANNESSVTTVDPSSIEFFPTWNRDQDLHQQTLSNGDPSPVWETVDGQNILFQYFGFGTTYRQSAPLTPLTNGGYYRVRIRFEGEYQAGTATFNDFAINFKRVPGPSRYYLGANPVTPYLMTLQTAPADGSIIYREWDAAEVTGATTSTGSVINSTTQDSQRRGFLSPITPLTYDWRAPYELNFDLEIDYTDTTAIPDPYLRQILPKKGANLIGSKVYICELNQIVNSPELGQVSLKDALELPVGLKTAPDFISAVVDEYENEVATGNTFTIQLPTLVTAGIVSASPQNPSGKKWWNSTFTYTNIEHEVLALAFVPPS